MKALSFVAALVAAAIVIAGVSYVSNAVRTADQPASVDDDPIPTPAESGPHPKVVIAEPGNTFDFGEMVVNESESHTFVVRNEGEAPLELKKLRTTCKCTLGEIGEASIAPGEETEIVLTYSPKAADEEFVQQAIIGTNDPEMDPIYLYVKGRVAPDAYVVPSGPWDFGTISEDADEPTYVQGAIVSGIQDDFEVLEMITEFPGVTATIDKDLSEEQIEFSKGKSGVKVTISVDPVVPVGRFMYPLKFRTNSERTPEITLDIGGTRAGPFTILGRGWIGANSLMKLGRFKAAEGVSRDLVMFVKKTDEPLEITPVSVTPDVVRIKLTKDDSYTNARQDKYVFTISIPAGVGPGLYEGEDDRVTVKTKANHPAFDEFNFNVEFAAE